MQKKFRFPPSILKLGTNTYDEKPTGKGGRGLNVPAQITRQDIDQLLYAMNSQDREIAAISEAFREINSSLRQLESVMTDTKFEELELSYAMAKQSHAS